MLKRLTVLGATMFLAVLPVATAQAATDITLGGSCTLSANWHLTTSANFNNTSGSPSTGTLDYTVIRSPGELRSASWVAISTTGATRGAGNLTLDRKLGSDFIYRGDAVTNGRTRWVDITGTAPSGISCTSRIYSQN